MADIIAGQPVIHDHVEFGGDALVFRQLVPGGGLQVAEDRAYPVYPAHGFRVNPRHMRGKRRPGTGVPEPASSGLAGELERAVP